MTPPDTANQCVCRSCGYEMSSWQWANHEACPKCGAPDSAAAIRHPIQAPAKGEANG